MEYIEGYVTFIDILGFSNYVSNEVNIEKTQDLFTFIEKFRYFYNSSPKLKTEISFFSDSIIITTSNFESAVVAVYIAESYLQKNIGLLFRGGLTYGKYYHENNVTFGPAVIAAYKLEQKAVYSRIIIDKELSNPIDEELLIFQDIDGAICCNPYATMINENISYGRNNVVYQDKDITKKIIYSFKENRNRLLHQIKIHKGSPVVDKYLWRIRPYNYTCDLIANMSCGEVLLEDPFFAVSADLKENTKILKITEKDICLL